MLGKLLNLFKKKDVSEKTKKSHNRQKIGHLEAHDMSNTKILGLYVNSISISLWIKNILKVMFFGVIIFILCYALYFFKYALDFTTDLIMHTLKPEGNGQISYEIILSAVTVIVPAVTSLIVAFLKLPEIIAKYLFNVKEDKYMKSIIRNIQQYDRDMYALANKVESDLARTMEEDEDDGFKSRSDKDNDGAA